MLLYAASILDTFNSEPKRQKKKKKSLVFIGFAFLLRNSNN